LVGHTQAPYLATAFAIILNSVGSQLRRSMTYDEGAEWAHRKTLSEQIGVYFAHPHSL